MALVGECSTRFARLTVIAKRLCGIGMSVVGAALATFFCGRFDSRNRPAARLLSNVLASLLAYVARVRNGGTVRGAAW